MGCAYGRLLLACLGVGLAGGARADETKMVVAERPLMGTTFRVVVDAEESGRLRAAMDAIAESVALATNGTVREARGFTSMRKISSTPSALGLTAN